MRKFESSGTTFGFKMKAEVEEKVYGEYRGELQCKWVKNDEICKAGVGGNGLYTQTCSADFKAL